MLDDLQPYVDALETLYAEILGVRNGEPTIVIAIDHYNPFLGGWRGAGVEAACTEVWETFSAAVEQAAADSGIRFVSMYDTLNGADHDQDPKAAGLLNAAMWQANEEGTKLMVDALMAVGLTPVSSPGG
jgi:hypothetical protein